MGKAVFTDTAFFQNGAVQSSDIRYKNNIKNLPELLPQVNDLDTFTYTWKDTPKLTLGVSAQQLEEKPVLKLLVSQDLEGTKSVEYSKLSVVALKCIQEQQEQINELKQELETLKLQRL